MPKVAPKSTTSSSLGGFAGPRLDLHANNAIKGKSIEHWQVYTSRNWVYRHGRQAAAADWGPCACALIQNNEHARVTTLYQFYLFNESFQGMFHLWFHSVNYVQLFTLQKLLSVYRRYVHISAVRGKAGYYKLTHKGDYPLTYEQAQPPYRIGVTKSWNTWNSGWCLVMLAVP